MPGDTVYVTVPKTGQDVRLYVVVDKAVWNNGDPLIDVSDGYESLKLETGTGTQTIQIWAPPLMIGSYDIVMDVDCDGVFDSGKDQVDSMLITGFFVVPEVPFGTLTILILMLISMAIHRLYSEFKSSKKRLQLAEL